MKSMTAQMSTDPDLPPAGLFAAVNGGRWLVAALLLAVTAIGAVAAHRHITLERELTEAALARRTSLAALAAATLTEKFERLVDIGVSLATRVRFQELVAAERWFDAAQILRRVPADFAFLDRVFIADIGGTVMADFPELPGARGTNFAHREWFREVSREWKPHVSQLYRRTAAPRRNVIAVSVPIRSADRKVAGILVLQVKIEAFFDWARRIDVGSEDRILVVDAAHRAAFDSTSPAIGLSALPGPLPAREARIPAAAGAEILRDDAQDDPLVRSFAPATHGWGVVILQPARAAFGTRDELLRQQLVDGALIAVFAVVAILFGTRILAQRRRERAERAHRDALERRVAERTATLDALNRELEDLYDRAPCGYHSVNGDGLIVRMNGTWLSWLGYAREEVVGKMRHPDLMTAASAERFRSEAFPLFRRQGWLADWEFEYRRKDGTTFTGSVNGTSILDAAGRFLMSRTTVTDVSARKRVEAALRAANQELEAFSYSVSHDLRAPLRAIDGFSRIVQEDYADRLDAEGRRLLGVIRGNSRKMAQLIDDLLAYSRLGRRPLASAEVDMNRLCEEVLGELRESGARSSGVVLEALPAARGDATLLKQVLANLLANAVKFSGKRERPQIVVSGVENEFECVYCVQDNGAGFDMRYGDKLFKVFQRLHREDEFDGTGVGLAIVQRVVARHGGRVWAEGRPDEGAAFHFALPRGGASGAI
jgi:PAS domain S-box-containing protein